MSLWGSGQVTEEQHGAAVVKLLLVCVFVCVGGMCE